MTPRKIVVAGGAGFLGSHLCALLLERGHDVTCVDNFLTGARDNIARWVGHPRFSLREHDVSEPLAAMSVDEIYNLACAASPQQYQRDPIHTLKTCVYGAMHLLELARQSGARYLQASTSEVYGDPHVSPQTEDYWGYANPVGPRACYDEGKRCAETLCFDYHRQHGVPVKVARIFNTYGPYMRPDDGRVVSNFIVQALRHEPITVYGVGTQTRSFCHVDDLIGGLVALMESADSVTGPVNLGNPTEITVRELADRVIALTDSHSRVVHLPLPQDDPRQRCPDIARARACLGWEPRVPLEQGLRDTVAYFRRLLHVSAGDAPRCAEPIRAA